MDRSAPEFASPVKPPRRNRSLPSWMLGCLLVARVCGAGIMQSSAQAPPILNSPYVCANGLTYTVTACQPYRADQLCQWHEDQNGQLVVAVNSTWTSMTGRLKGCTNDGPAKASAAAPVTTTAPQNLNPAYLREFPSPDQVLAKVKGTSPQDTAYRQLSALREFGQVIAGMAGPRLAQNQMTPDEIRLLTGYFNAYNTLANATANPQDAYLNRPGFAEGLFQTFNMPTAAQAWQNATKQAAAQQAAASPQSSPLQQSTDPTQVKARRCIELGGSTLQCTTAGLGAGLFSMIGIDPDALTKSNAPTGLVMFGSYSTPAGMVFGFGDSSVNIVNCGAMVQGSHAYSLQLTGNQYSIKIANDPQPIAMALSADGRLSGPAAQDITGQKIKGYFVHTNLKTGASTRTPDYTPVTVHCPIGILKTGQATAPASDMSAATAGAISATMALMSGASPDASLQTPVIAPGPRFTGLYRSARGLQIAFDDGSAVIDCAQAHVKAAYDVAASGGSVKINVKNAGSPITLTLMPNGSLSGAGATTVNGKLMTGLNGDAPILVATSARCPVDSLTAAK